MSLKAVTDRIIDKQVLDQLKQVKELVKEISPGRRIYLNEDEIIELLRILVNLDPARYRIEDPEETPGLSDIYERLVKKQYLTDSLHGTDLEKLLHTSLVRIASRELSQIRDSGQGMHWTRNYFNLELALSFGVSLPEIGTDLQELTELFKKGIYTSIMQQIQQVEKLMASTDPDNRSRLRSIKDDFEDFELPEALKYFTNEQLGLNQEWWKAFYLDSVKDSIELYRKDRTYIYRLKAAFKDFQFYGGNLDELQLSPRFWRQFERQLRRSGKKDLMKKLLSTKF